MTSSLHSGAVGQLIDGVLVNAALDPGLDVAAVLSAGLGRLLASGE